MGTVFHASGMPHEQRRNGCGRSGAQLRGVDASSMPLITSANTNPTNSMIGEKGADIFRHRIARGEGHASSANCYRVADMAVGIADLKVAKLIRE